MAFTSSRALLSANCLACIKECKQPTGYLIEPHDLLKGKKGVNQLFEYEQVWPAATNSSADSRLCQLSTQRLWSRAFRLVTDLPKGPYPNASQV